MRILKFLTITVLLTVLAISQATAKTVVQPKTYVFGFIANFTDSVVYFTDIQELDSACIDTKTKFLFGRSEYAYQLKSYFADSLKMPHRTCIVSYGLTRKDAEKKYLKMKKLYTQKNAGKYEVHYLNENEFKFQTVSAEVEGQSDAAPEKPRKEKPKGDKPRKERPTNKPPRR